MLETKLSETSPALQVRSPLLDRLEISRMLAAAVVSPKFCKLLLADPEQALEDGYEEETFCFTSAERDLIISIQADSLADLAEQLGQSIEGKPLTSVKVPAEPVGGSYPGC